MRWSRRKWKGRAAWGDVSEAVRETAQEKEGPVSKAADRSDKVKKAQGLAIGLSKAENTGDPVKTVLRETV